MWSLLVSVLVSVLIVLVFRFINKGHKPVLFGVYQQENKYYWLKFVLLLLVLNVRQWLWRFKRRYAVEAGKSDDGTIHVHTEDAALEQKHDLGSFPQAADALFFNGISKDGNAVAFALARRQSNVCDAHVYIKINGEEYLTPKLPDTYLLQEENDTGEYKVQGIEIENFMPMRTWKLTYNGEMTQKCKPEKSVKIQAEFTWSAIFAPFVYEFQMSPLSMACDMARETWSRDYFSTVKNINQTHYEQVGSLKGVVKIDGKESALKMPSFRDRTFGKNLDWKIFHRYVYHTLYLDNGDCVVIGTISQPLVISHLTAGYVCRKSDQTTLAVQSSDFKLYQHGENQVPPKDYAFTFMAGGQRYDVRVTEDSEHVYYIGKNREAIMYDRWLSVDVNGITGRGYGQWHYNNSNP